MSLLLIMLIIMMTNADLAPAEPDVKQEGELES